MTKNKISNGSILAAALALGLASCVRDKLYNTPHPDKGAIVVQMDWSDLLPEAVADTYILNIDGCEQTVSGDTNCVERLAEPGEHTLMVYNRPDYITIDGDIASVNETIGGRAADGSDAEEDPYGSLIASLPGYLFSLSRTVVVERDDTLHIPAKPRQWVRQMDLTLSVADGDYSRITMVRSTLFGVERSVDIRKGERQGTVAHVRSDFTAGDGNYRVSFRLMGIVPAVHQVMMIEVYFANGERQVFGDDITELLAAFNDGTEPLRLTSDLYLPLKAGASGSIEGWKIADGGNTDIY